MVIESGRSQLFGNWFGEAARSDPQTRKICYGSSTCEGGVPSCGLL